MDFPARSPKPVAVHPLLEKALGVKPLAAYQSRDLMILVENAGQVRELKPDLAVLQEIPDCFAFIVTAEGDAGFDFVSRFFAPGCGIPEDPVTGSSHATLIPFWAEKLGKNTLLAAQVSKRGGVLYCENVGERVKISGKAVLYLEGELKLSNS